jgi:hypothetical protein
MQSIDLVIQIDLKIFAGILKFRLTRHQYSWGNEQEGPDYKGMLVHTSLPGTFIWLLAKASLPVLIYEE